MRGKGCALWATAIAAMFIGGAANADSHLERGQEKALQCVACHGAEGMTPNPTFPHLAGQNAAYLQMQLHHFKTGERYHALMSPVAETLTPEDMADLAAYFSSIGSSDDSP